MKKSVLERYSFEIAMLQSYLLEIFSHAANCEHNFKNSEWYLDQKMPGNLKNEILDYFRDNGVNCDCGILKFRLKVEESAD